MISFIASGVPIRFSDSTAESKIDQSSLGCAKVFARAGIESSVPISPNAIIAFSRTFLSSSCNDWMMAGVASFASVPMAPNAHIEPILTLVFSS